MSTEQMHHQFTNDDRPNNDELQELAHRHLWMHFSRLGSPAEIRIWERGEGCRVWDTNGREYLDALSGLFTVQVGHGRHELAAAAARQAETLEYFPIWGYGHIPAIKLAARIAGARARRPQSRLLHQRRLRGRRVGVEARRASTSGPRVKVNVTR